MLYLPYQMGGYSLKIINQNVELISQQKIDILLWMIAIKLETYIFHWKPILILDLIEHELDKIELWYVDIKF